MAVHPENKYGPYLLHTDFRRNHGPHSITGNPSFLLPALHNISAADNLLHPLASDKLYVLYEL